MFTSKRLKELRKQRKETQSQIASFLHVSLRAYGNYERGHRIPDPDELEKLAEHFNVPIQYLLGESLNSDGYLVALSGKNITELTEEQKTVIKQTINIFLKQNKKQ